MKIKKGDTIQAIAGKDKGKTGQVSQVFPKKNRATVDGLNSAIKHLRPNRQGEKGQRVEFSAPMNMSNMALICPKCSKKTRVGYKVEVNADGKKVKSRICKKCNEVIS